MSRRLHGSVPCRSARLLLLVSFLATACELPALAGDDLATAEKLKGFDAYMAKVVKDWNVPGIGVGIVVKDKLVFAKGYGYRDYGKKLPFTATTVQPIASNTKLFTAVVDRPAGRGRQARLGQAGPPVRAEHPVLQRRAERDRHDARHALAPHRHHAPRHDLVQVRLHAQGAVRAAQVPGAVAADPPDVPLQQHDVHRRRIRGRAAVGQDVGGVRARADLRAARHERARSSPSPTW